MLTYVHDEMKGSAHANKADEDMCRFFKHVQQTGPHIHKCMSNPKDNLHR